MTFNKKFGIFILAWVFLMPGFFCAQTVSNGKQNLEGSKGSASSHGLRLAPDFRLKDQKGREYRLEDFRGSLLLVNFWATWCPPCVEELPSMDALGQHMRAKRFNMVAVSVDDGWPVINDFLAGLNRKPSFLILNDPSRQLAALYGTDKYPESYLIDEEGKILKKYEGAFQWMDEKILQEIEGYLSRGSIPQVGGSKSTQIIKAK